MVLRNHLRRVIPKRKLGHEINCMVAFPVKTSRFHLLSSSLNKAGVFPYHIISNINPIDDIR